MEHVEIALAEKGVREFPGRYNNNPEILKYANDSGLYSDGTDELPWCSAFMNWVAVKSDLERSKKSNARSWLDIGLEIDEPVKGDIAIFWRGTRSGWQGHVGIFWEYTPSEKYINVLGGNQSNSVNIARYAIQRLLGFRRLRKFSLNDLRMGSIGTAVRDLQIKLNQAAYKCGNVDGHFGKQTENAIVRLQCSGKLQITGVYNEATKVLLEGIIESKRSSNGILKSYGVAANKKTKPISKPKDQNKRNKAKTSSNGKSDTNENKKKTHSKVKDKSTKSQQNLKSEFNFDDIFNEDVFEFDWDN